MTPRDFVFWLQGHMEINDPESITVEQVDMIKSHIDLTLLELSKKKLTTPQTTSSLVAGSYANGIFPEFC